MKNYNLDFHGFFRECNKSGLPEKDGIYCVYTCKYNKKEDKVSDLFLLYIGDLKILTTDTKIISMSIIVIFALAWKMVRHCVILMPLYQTMIGLFSEAAPL